MLFACIDGYTAMKGFQTSPAGSTYPGTKLPNQKKTKSAAKRALPRRGADSPSRRFSVSELGPTGRDDRRRWGTTNSRLPNLGAQYQRLSKCCQEKFATEPQNIPLCVSNLSIYSGSIATRALH